MNDVIGNADMVQGANTAFTADRFGNPNSALNLNGGYTQVPAGFYFNTPQFTISAWINPSSLGFLARLLDFGNGPLPDNIILTLTDSPPQTPFLYLIYGRNLIGRVESNVTLENKVWQFFVVTVNTTHINMYINGTLVGSSVFRNTLQPVIRKLNYIGKSNWDTDGYSYSYIDELRFYNISLSQSQIIELKAFSGTSTTTTTKSEYL